MFEGLNALPWYDLKHAYGSGEEVPMWLRQLLSSNNEIREDAMGHLSSSICHQGWISPATAYAVPYLLEILQEPAVDLRVYILKLLAEIAHANPQLYEDKWRQNARVGIYNVPAEISFKDAHLEVSKGIPIYLTLLEDAALDVRIQTTELLMDIATLTPDVQKRLIKILKNENERKVRANLLIMLCNLRLPGPDVQELCWQIMQTDKDNLTIFCAACGLARLEKKDRDDTFRKRLHQIFRKYLPKVYPEIPTKQIGTRGEGHLLHINEKFFFRIPDSPAAIASMKREVSILQTLQGRLTLTIPDPIYTDLEAIELGQIFMGYHIINGKPLYKEMLESVPGEEVVEILALNIADFLYRLHHISLVDIASIGLPITHERKKYELLFERVQMDLFPYMQPEICRQIAACFVTFLDTATNFALEPVLIHGSMGPERIIYDARRHAISGIVGFNQACLDDPAKDVAALLGPRGYGQNFIQRFERVYPELAAMRARIEFYMNATVLQTELKRTSEQELKNIAGRLTFHSY